MGDTPDIIERFPILAGFHFVLQNKNSNERDGDLYYRIY